MDEYKSLGLPLPTGENDLVVATGEGWCAVGSDTNAVRIFTSVSGSLKMHFQVNGPLLAMVGEGSWLMLLYHQVGGGIQYIMRHFPKSSLQAASLGPTGLLPTTTTTLRWLGFTDANVPVILTAHNVLLTFQWQQQSWWPLDL